MKVKVLTIDWDYLFKASREVRDNNFPEIEDGELNYLPDNSLWISSCAWNSDHSFDIEAYKQLFCAMCISNYNGFAVSENHGEVANFIDYIKSLSSSIELEVTNIDYHHDYSYSGSHPRCDNWARIVSEKYPDTKLLWCKREDSVTTSFGVEVPVEDVSFETILENLKSGYYQYVHICRSDLYSPPLNVSDDAFYSIVGMMYSRSPKDFAGHRNSVWGYQIQERYEVVEEYSDLYKKVNDNEKSKTEKNY